MQSLQFAPTMQRYIVAAIAVTLSLVVATSAPIKALTVQQALVGTAKELQTRINTAIDASIVAIEQNEKDMAALNENLKGAGAQVAQALTHTRDQINSYVQDAEAIKQQAEQLVQKGATALNSELTKVGVAAGEQLQHAVKTVEGFVETGKAITESAKELVAQGEQKLEELRSSAEQFTKEQIAAATAAINEQVAVANDIVKQVDAQVQAGVAFVADNAQKVGVAAGEQLQNAVKTVEGFVATGKTVVAQAEQQVAAGVEMLQTKVQSDLQAMKDAVKIEANESGVNARVNFGNGVVTYTSITIPPEVAENLKKTSQKAAAALASIQGELEKLTDPNEIKAKAQEAIKQINNAALTSVSARTTKAINSQIAVIDSLQVSANSLQTQIDKLKQCIRESSNTDECNALRTEQNSADQGAALQEKISAIRVNIETVRSFLAASVDLTALLKDENYRGTIQSLTAMTTMIASISTLSDSLRNDLNNLTNAVNN